MSNSDNDDKADWGNDSAPVLVRAVVTDGITKGTPSKALLLDCLELFARR